MEDVEPIHPALVAQFKHHKTRIIEFLEHNLSNTEPEVLSISRKCIRLMKYIEIHDNTFIPKPNHYYRLIQRLESIHNAIIHYKLSHNMDTPLRSTSPIPTGRGTQLSGHGSTDSSMFDSFSSETSSETSGSQ